LVRRFFYVEHLSVAVMRDLLARTFQRDMRAPGGKGSLSILT